MGHFIDDEAFQEMTAGITYSLPPARRCSCGQKIAYLNVNEQCFRCLQRERNLRLRQIERSIRADGTPTGRAQSLPSHTRRLLFPEQRQRRLSL